MSDAYLITVFKGADGKWYGKCGNRCTHEGNIQPKSAIAAIYHELTETMNNVYL